MRSSARTALPILMPLLLLLLCLLAGCGNAGAAGPTSNLEGLPLDILNQILEDAGKSLPDERPMPMAFVAEVTAETSQNQIGLSDADFLQYVDSASVATAAIATFAHEIALIQAKDSAAAAEIKKRIAGDGGYNAQKWICVFPEQSSVIESGPYVLLAVSRADVVEAVITAFTDAAGSVGTTDTFFTSAGMDEAAAPPVGGGMGLAIN